MDSKAVWLHFEVGGPKVGKSAGELRIGRGGDPEIVFTDPSVNQLHAIITPTEDGFFLVNRNGVHCKVSGRISPLDRKSH